MNNTIDATVIVAVIGAAGAGFVAWLTFLSSRQAAATAAFKAIIDAQHEQIEGLTRRVEYLEHENTLLRLKIECQGMEGCPLEKD